MATQQADTHHAVHVRAASVAHADHIVCDMPRDGDGSDTDAVAMTLNPTADTSPRPSSSAHSADHADGACDSADARPDEDAVAAVSAAMAQHPLCDPHLEVTPPDPALERRTLGLLVLTIVLWPLSLPILLLAYGPRSTWHLLRNLGYVWRREYAEPGVAGFCSSLRRPAPRFRVLVALHHHATTVLMLIAVIVWARSSSPDPRDRVAATSRAMTGLQLLYVSMSVLSRRLGMSVWVLSSLRFSFSPTRFMRGLLHEPVSTLEVFGQALSMFDKSIAMRVANMLMFSLPRASGFALEPWQCPILSDTYDILAETFGGYLPRVAALERAGGAIRFPSGPLAGRHALRTVNPTRAHLRMLQATRQDVSRRNNSEPSLRSAGSSWIAVDMHMRVPLLAPAINAPWFSFATRVPVVFVVVAAAVPFWMRTQVPTGHADRGVPAYGYGSDDTVIVVILCIVELLQLLVVHAHAYTNLLRGFFSIWGVVRGVVRMVEPRRRLSRPTLGALQTRSMHYSAKALYDCMQGCMPLTSVDAVCAVEWMLRLQIEAFAPGGIAASVTFIAGLAPSLSILVGVILAVTFTAAPDASAGVGVTADAATAHRSAIMLSSVIALVSFLANSAVLVMAFLAAQRLTSHLQSLESVIIIYEQAAVRALTAVMLDVGENLADKPHASTVEMTTQVRNAEATELRLLIDALRSARAYINSLIRDSGGIRFLGVLRPDAFSISGVLALMVSSSVMALRLNYLISGT